MNRSIRLGQKLPRQITQLRQNIAEWRKTRVRRVPMPAPLWSSAVALTREYTVCSVARTLRIDYKALRTRATVISVAEAKQLPLDGFIELLPPASTAILPRETVLECSDASGFKITLRQNRGADIDMIRLVEVFSRRSGTR